MLYLEDLSPGQIFDSRSITLSAEEIKSFAGQYDPQPFHLDEATATDTFFGALVASGWQTGAVTMRLLVESVPLAGGLIGMGGEVAWPAPVHPGDSLSVRTEVLEVRPSRSRPDIGQAVIRSTTSTQAGQAVQIATMRVLARRRPAQI